MTFAQAAFEDGPATVLQVVAQGDDAHASGDATVIAHQCALLRGVIPVLATPKCNAGAMATDGSLTDWALRTVRERPLWLLCLRDAAPRWVARVVTACACLPAAATAVKDAGP